MILALPIHRFDFSNNTTATGNSKFMLMLLHFLRGFGRNLPPQKEKSPDRSKELLNVKIASLCELMKDVLADVERSSLQSVQRHHL